MTYARSRKPVLMLNGLWADEVSLSTERNIQDYGFYRKSYLARAGRRRCDLNCRFIIPASYNIAVAIFESLDGQGLFSMGAGRLCPYCGAYNCAGVVRCYACGGSTEHHPFLSVRQFPFVCCRRTVAGFIDGNDIMTLEVDFVSYEDPVFEYIDGEITFGMLNTLPNYCTLFPEYHLCDFCGTVYEGNRSCPNCGGQRFPWSELIKMDRKCLYCGRKVIGGIVCRSCGAGIAGTAVKEVLENRPWIKNALPA